jgi:hypothetical protein
VVLLAAGLGCAKKPDKPLTPEDVMSRPDARLRSIILTDVELRNMPLDEAIRFLNEESRKADPDKVGVTIQLREFRLVEVIQRVNVRYQQATVMQVLDDICRQSHCGYLVEKDRITILSEDHLKSVQPPPRYFSSPKLPY